MQFSWGGFDLFKDLQDTLKPRDNTYFHQVVKKQDSEKTLIMQ